MDKPPALVKRYVLVASLPGWCVLCDREKRMWVRRIHEGRWTFMPCPHCTDSAPLHDVLEGVE